MSTSTTLPIAAPDVGDDDGWQPPDYEADLRAINPLQAAADAVWQERSEFMGGASRLISSAELRKRPAPTWRIEKTMPPTGVGQMFGPSYSGKTYVGLDLALRTANGLEWFGRAVNLPGPVVYVLMEGSWGFARRVDAWLAGHPGATDDNLYVLSEQPLDLADIGSLANLVADIELLDTSPALIILDTQSLAAPTTDENSNSEMTAVFSNLKLLSRTLDAFVLTVHHTGHGGKGKQESRGRGASAQFANLDLCIAVEKSSPDSPEGRLKFTKIKEMEPSFWMTFQFHRVPECDQSYVDPQPETTPLEQADLSAYVLRTLVISFIRDNPGCSSRQLEGAIQGKAAKVREMRAALVLENVIRQEPGPRQSHLHYLVDEPAA